MTDRFLLLVLQVLDCSSDMFPHTTSWPSRAIICFQITNTSDHL